MGDLLLGDGAVDEAPGVMDLDDVSLCRLLLTLAFREDLVLHTAFERGHLFALSVLGEEGLAHLTLDRQV